jgi:integrase
MDNSKATIEWLDSRKQNVRWQYKHRWQIWVDYCTQKGIPENGSEQLADMKKRRLSEDNTVKYFYDNEIPRFFQWLQTEYKGKTTNRPLSESSALAVTTAIRSFFSYHRYSLEIKKEALPSSEKVAQTYEDHAFDIYQLRSMFNCGDLQERTILACGKDLWLRIGDLTSLKRDLIELAIKREQELAENEKREPDIIEFEMARTEKEKEPCSCHLSRETVELLKDYLRTYPKTSEKLFPLTEDALNDLLRRLAENEKREPDIIEFEMARTEKEKEPCSCHLSRETVELLKDYLRTYPKTSEKLFPLTEDALNDLLRRLAEKSKITVSGRIRWHCLRKFGITLMHGKITEPVMKYMTGKHISKDLKVYIQNNRETFKAFKMIEPLISLTKQNGNGSSQLSKQIEELKKETFKRIILEKFIEKSVSKERKAEILNELAEELGLTKEKEVHTVLTEDITKPTPLDLDTAISILAKAYEKKDLERILKENNNH